MQQIKERERGGEEKGSDPDRFFSRVLNSDPKLWLFLCILISGMGSYRDYIQSKPDPEQAHRIRISNPGPLHYEVP